MLDRGLELDGQVGVDAVVLEVVLLQHWVVQPAWQAAGLDMLHLRSREGARFLVIPEVGQSHYEASSANNEN